MATADPSNANTPLVVIDRDASLKARLNVVEVT